MGIMITVFLPLALVVIMFSLGLGLTVADFVRVARYPKAFAVGFISQFIVIPSLAFAICNLFRLSPETALGLMIVGLCPGGATSNIMTRFSHGDVALSISLNGVSNLVAVFTVPVLVAFFADYFLGLDAPEIDVGTLGLTVFALTTVPVVAGLLTRRQAPAIADAIDRPMKNIALVLLVIVIAGALASNWGLFIDNLPTLGPSVVILGATCLAAGLAVAKLASLERPQATAISIDTGIQNAALGITVGAIIGGAGAAFPPYSVPAGVYGVTMYLVVIPFVFWRRRRALIQQAGAPAA